jgi:hypothetical protein
MKTSNPAKFKTRNWLVCDCDKCGEVWMAASGNAIAREFGKSSCPFRDRNAIKPKHKWHRRHHRRAQKPATVLLYQYWKIGRDARRLARQQRCLASK